jgi:UDP-2,3-diacylglucosamine pyrophosphatase LpxH
MLIVLSDLHLSEAQSTQVGGMRFNRNLPSETYQDYFTEINQIVLANKIKKVDFVLDGDILELTRSAFWLDGEDRPYMDNSAVTEGSDAEKTLLKIINAICAEEKVAETIHAFRKLESFFDCEINLHYLLGNHDRLVNTTPAVRRRVREAFGLAGDDALFDHRFIFKTPQDQPLCFVRHGHEYDRVNFSFNTDDLETIPTDFSEEVYGRPCLGDIITIEFGAALPRYFVEVYGEDAILKDPTLLALYKRLMAFDDVRPTTALLAYLFSMPEVKKRLTWEYMKPCIEKAFDTISDNEALSDLIQESDSLGKGQRLLLDGILDLDLLERGVPYWVVKQLMKNVSKQIKLKSQTRWAKREELINDPNSECRCVISGHTHFPEISLISARKGDEKYYINTGTWRNIIPATKNFKEFGMLEAMTKVVLFSHNEKNNSSQGSPWSFQYLSGVNYGNHRFL